MAIPSTARAVVFGFNVPHLKDAYGGIIHFISAQDVRQDLELSSRLEFVAINPKMSSQHKDRIRDAADGLNVVEPDNPQVLTNLILRLVEVPSRTEPKADQIDPNAPIVLVGFETTPRERILLHDDNVRLETMIQGPQHTPRGTGLILVCGDATTDRVILTRRAFRLVTNTTVLPCDTLEKAVVEINKFRGPRESPLVLPPRGDEQPVPPKKDTPPKTGWQAPLLPPQRPFQSPFAIRSNGGSKAISKIEAPVAPLRRQIPKFVHAGSFPHPVLNWMPKFAFNAAVKLSQDLTAPSIDPRLQKVRDVKTQPHTLSEFLRLAAKIEHIDMVPMAAAAELKTLTDKGGYLSGIRTIYTTWRLVLISAGLWKYSDQNRSKRVSTISEAQRPAVTKPEVGPLPSSEEMKRLTELCRRRGDRIEELKGHLDTRTKEWGEVRREAEDLRLRLRHEVAENSRLGTLLDKAQSEITKLRDK